MTKRSASRSASQWLATRAPTNLSACIDVASFDDVGTLPPPIDTAPSNIGATKAPESRRWQVNHTKSALLAEFPEGVPPEISNKAVLRRIEPTFKRKGLKPPSIDTIARARGRRKQP